MSLAATLPMPPLPQPATAQHFVLLVSDQAQQISVRCWCGSNEELDLYSAWAGRCVQRFCLDHATCANPALRAS